MRKIGPQQQVGLVIQEMEILDSRGRGPINRLWARSIGPYGILR